MGLLSGILALMTLNEVMVLKPHCRTVIEEDEPDGAHQKHTKSQQGDLEVDGHGDKAAGVSEPVQVASFILVSDLHFCGRVHSQERLDRQAERQASNKK